MNLGFDIGFRRVAVEQGCKALRAGTADKDT